MKSWLKLKEELAEAVSKVNTGEGVFDRAEIKRVIEMQKQSLQEHSQQLKLGRRMQRTPCSRTSPKTSVEKGIQS